MSLAYPIGLRVLLACALAGLAAAAQARKQTLALPDGGEIEIHVFPGSGRALLLWLPSEAGVLPAQERIAAALAAGGMEVWLADVLSARFLPALPSSLEQVPAEDVAALIARAAKGKKRVYLLGDGRAAVPILRGAALAQAQGLAPDGAVLLSPNLYVQTPDAGTDARYLPIATQTRLPMVILQPMLSPWRWWIDRLRAALESGGSAVHVESLPGLRDRFYFRPDATARETAAARALSAHIGKAIDTLEARQVERR